MLGVLDGSPPTYVCGQNYIFTVKVRFPQATLPVQRGVSGVALDKLSRTCVRA